MAKIPEYFSQAEAETSRLPRAPAGLADIGQGLEAQALVGLGGALGKVGQLLADIEIEKQRARDNVTLAEMKGALDDFEFQSRPETTQFTKIEDFKKAEVQFGKDWQREYQRISKGSNRRVSDQFKIYTELHWDTARRDYHNKSWPLEQNYALAQFDRLWSGKLQKFVSKPVKLKGELQALIKQFDAYLKPTQKQNLEAGLDKSIESNQIQSLINLDPISAMEAIDNLSSIFNEKEKNILRSQTRAAIARKERERSIQLQSKSEETAKNMLADYWDGKLTDPQVITDALRLGYLDDTDAKYLRNAILNPDPPKLNLKSLATVKQVIEEIGTNTKTVQQALSVLFANIDSIDPTTGKSLVTEIFSEQDKNKSEIKRESRHLMEELVRDRDKFTGMFTDDERQILAAAEAYLMLDAEIQKAVETGKPLERRDIMIKAIQIGRQMKAKIKQEEADAIPPEFSPETEGYPTAPRAPDYTAKGKPIIKGALAKPDFALTSEGEPEKVFDSKGREIGLRRRSGAIFKIGYHAIFGGKKYEYTGNGNWKLVK